MGSWVPIIVYVVGYDALAIHAGKPTLSRTFWKTLDHPWYGPALLGGTVTVAAHLLRFRYRKDCVCEHGTAG